MSAVSSRRRKEVALGRLSTLTVILIFGVWGAATEGAFPDDAAPSPAPAARKPAPVPPTKYLDAAQMYRDQLQGDEQASLDAYLKELAKVQASPQPAAPAAPAAAAAP